MVNKVILLGRTGKDTEVSQLGDRGIVAKTTVATNETYTDRAGSRVERTEWHSLTLWGKLAELAGQYLTKGRLIYVEGRLHHSSYEDKDGKRQYRTEVVVDRFRILDRKEDVAERPAVPGKAAGYDPNPEPEFTDDLPF